MEKKEPLLNIGFNSIVRECSLIPEYNKLHFDALNESTYHIIHEIFKYRKFQYDFADFLTLYKDDNDLLGTFRPSYDEFITRVAYFLNTKLEVPIIDDDNFEMICKERIKRLQETKTPEKLQIEFPILYQDYIQGRQYMEYLRNEKSNLSEEEFNKNTHYYYSCALKESFKSFIERQTELYNRFIDRRKEYKEKIETRNCNRYLKEYFDWNKLGMLVMSKYLEICENETDRLEIKKYLSIIGKYISSDFDHSVSITTDEGRVINIKDILQRYYELQQKIKNDYIVNWEIVPESEELFETEPKQNNPRQLKMSKEEKERLKRIGSEKTQLYESSNYLLKVRGIKQYSGYIAYIYENGEVLLDKKYNPNGASTATGNAIYHMKAIDFEELSKLDKATLRRHPRVERIIHRKNWQDRVKEIISQEGTEESIESAKALVKKIRKK